MGTFRFIKALSAFVLVLFISCSDDNGDDESFEQLSRDQVRLTIEVIPAGSGVVYPNSGNFDEGSEVTLRPDANSGYLFSHWTGDISSEHYNQSIIMDSDKSITAVFRETKNNFLNPQE